MTAITPTDPARGGEPDAIRAVPVRHPGRWAAAVVVAVLAAMFVHSIVTNDNYRWDVQASYAFSEPILHGVATTLELTLLAMLIGIVLGVIVAVMRLSPSRLVSGAAWAYIWAFRGTPLLVQLIMWANVGALYRTFGLGIPFGPEFVHFQTFKVIPGFAAALLGLGLNEGAYMAEIVRAGILSVDDGQHQAASALGMSRLLTLRRVVLPQAMRVIVPPTGNETISMLKNTALVAYVPYYELLFRAQNIYTHNYQVIPILIMASLWYLALTSVLMLGQYYLEKHFSRGTTTGALVARRGMGLISWLSGSQRG